MYVVFKLDIWELKAISQGNICKINPIFIDKHIVI